MRSRVGSRRTAGLRSPGDGWAPPSLVGTYEPERRPIALHNIKRAAQPAGARATAGEALPWDLNGRLAHHWIPTRDRPVSTLDLVGDGITVLAGPGDPRWTGAKTHHPRSAPVTVHVLDAGTADALELQPGGAMLVRPDGRQACTWPDYDAWLRTSRPGPLDGLPRTSPAARIGRPVRARNP